MAYPSTIASFPTHVDGQTIFAADINNIQTEVVAIETFVGTISSVAGTLENDIRNPLSNGGGHVQQANVGGTGQTSYNKGDLLVASSSSVLSKVSVGTDGQALVADSTQTSGVSYKTTALSKFGGTGADGALSLTVGSILSLGNQAVVTKNYTSISITANGAIACTNPNANGTILILKSQGNITLTGSSSLISMQAMGASGGGGGSGTGAGSPGNIPNGTFYTATMVGGAGGVQAGASGAAGVAPFSSVISLGKYGGVFIVGAGGGGGGGGSNTGATGGIGGGGLIIEGAGAWNFTTANGISVAGGAGGNGGSGSGAAGGGGGGFAFITVGSVLANSGTINISGGSGGTAGTTNSVGGSGGASQIKNGVIGGGSNGIGGAGGNGWSSVMTNTEYT